MRLRSRATTRASTRSAITTPEGYTWSGPTQLFTELEGRLRKLPA